MRRGAFSITKTCPLSPQLPTAWQIKTGLPRGPLAFLLMWIRMSFWLCQSEILLIYPRTAVILMIAFREFTRATASWDMQGSSRHLHSSIGTPLGPSEGLVMLRFLDCLLKFAHFKIPDMRLVHWIRRCVVSTPKFSSLKCWVKRQTGCNTSILPYHLLGIDWFLRCLSRPTAIVNNAMRGRCP